MDELTNDAKFLLSMMYKEYVDRRKNDMTKKEATDFNDETYIAKEIMPEWKPEDVHFTIAELSRNEYLNAKAAGNKFLWVSLSTKAISSLELTFVDRVDLVLEFASKIKNSIPFL